MNLKSSQGGNHVPSIPGVLAPTPPIQFHILESTESPVSIFTSDQFGDIRIHIDVEGDPWFAAKDVAEALEYSESSLETVGKLIQHVPGEWRDRKQIPVSHYNEWKGVKPIHTPGGTQEMLCLSEQGLYFFLARSDKPKALPFQKWLAGEVLPAIRRHGGYLSPEKVEEALLNPDTLIRLATDLKEERARRAALEAQAKADRSKVLFAEAVSVSDSTISIGDLAKLIQQASGMKIGRSKLFIWLRERGYLIRQKGIDWNMPTQRSMDLGLFVIRESTRQHPEKGPQIDKTPRVTGKGQTYFINKFMNGQGV